MKYRKIYKYELVDGFVSPTKCLPPMDRKFSKWLFLSRNGWLQIAEGYSWDGASGPAIDTKDFMIQNIIISARSHHHFFLPAVLKIFVSSWAPSASSITVPECVSC